MPEHRKRYDAAFKAKVAIEAIKGQRTLNEIASAYRIPNNYKGSCSNGSFQSNTSKQCLRIGSLKI